MIQSCTEEQWREMFPKPWEMLERTENSSFPLYHDGVKTEESFFTRTKDAFNRKDEEMLIFIEQGTALGWAHTYWIPEEQYLGLVSMVVIDRFGKALEELLSYWEKRFPGYQWTSYFPEENIQARSVLEGRKLLPQAREAVGVLTFAQYSFQRESGQVMKLGRENFELFQQVHRIYESEMYWTNNRIEAQLDAWTIYGYVEGEKCLGVLYYNGVGGKDLEIFGLDLLPGTDSYRIGKALLVSALNQAKRNGARSIYFFHDPALTNVVKEMGFRILTIATAYSAVMGENP